MDTRDTALTLLVAVEGAHAYSAFLPSIFTIREFRNDATQTDIRIGEGLATAFVLILGLIVTGIVDSALPFWIAIVTAIAMLNVYEWALRTPRASQKMNTEEA